MASWSTQTDGWWVRLLQRLFGRKHRRGQRQQIQQARWRVISP